MPFPDMNEPAFGWSGALFWFNWEVIVQSSHLRYGEYVYKHVLPLLLDNRSDMSLKISGMWMFYDGDCLPQAEVDVPTTGLEEHLRMVAAADRVHEFYVVGVFGTGEPNQLDDMHRNLTDSRVIGYLGKTSVRVDDFEQFDQLMARLSLVHACDIYGRYLVKRSFVLLSDTDLAELGFEVVDESL
jgi:hypothetical protein